MSHRTNKYYIHNEWDKNYYKLMKNQYYQLLQINRLTNIIYYTYRLVYITYKFNICNIIIINLIYI